MTKTTTPTYSIVIPCYNSDKSLVTVTEKIADFFAKSKKAYEIILIDDASPKPDTWKTITTLAKKNKHIKALQLNRNFGQMRALLCGFNHASGKYIITMDDDGQHQPKDIEKLIKKQDHDIVYGYFKKKQHTLLQRVGSNVVSYIMFLVAKKPKHIKLSSFRLIKRHVIDAIVNIKTPYPYIDAMMFYVSRDVVNVNTKHGKRFFGKSNYTLRSMLKLFSNLLINNSSLMLRSIGIIGLSLAAISVIAAVILIIKKLTGSPLIGWTSIMVTMLFFGGAILFTLGIIGEYLHRIIYGIEKKPVFVVRNKINCK